MSKKKYKLKGVKPEKKVNIGTTPDGVPFIEMIEGKEKITAKFLHRNVEFYKNGLLISRFDRLENTVYYPITAERGATNDL